MTRPIVDWFSELVFSESLIGPGRKNHQRESGNKWADRTISKSASEQVAQLASRRLDRTISKSAAEIKNKTKCKRAVLETKCNAQRSWGLSKRSLLPTCEASPLFVPILVTAPFCWSVSHSVTHKHERWIWFTLSYAMMKALLRLVAVRDTKQAGELRGDIVHFIASSSALVLMTQNGSIYPPLTQTATCLLRWESSKHVAENS